MEPIALANLSMHLDDPGREVKSHHHASCVLWLMHPDENYCSSSSPIISSKQPALSHTSHPVVWKSGLPDADKNGCLKKNSAEIEARIPPRNFLLFSKQWRWFQKRFGNLSNDFLPDTIKTNNCCASGALARAPSNSLPICAHRGTQLFHDWPPPKVPPPSR